MSKNFMMQKDTTYVDTTSWSFSLAEWGNPKELLRYPDQPSSEDCKNALASNSNVESPPELTNSIKTRNTSLQTKNVLAAATAEKRSPATAEKRSRLEAFTFDPVRKNTISDGFNFRSDSSQNTTRETRFLFSATPVVSSLPASTELSFCNKRNTVPANDQSTLPHKKPTNQPAANAVDSNLSRFAFVSSVDSMKPIAPTNRLHELATTGNSPSMTDHTTDEISGNKSTNGQPGLTTENSSPSTNRVFSFAPLITAFDTLSSMNEISATISVTTPKNNDSTTTDDQCEIMTRKSLSPDTINDKKTIAEYSVSDSNNTKESANTNTPSFPDTNSSVFLPPSWNILAEMSDSTQTSISSTNPVRSDAVLNSSESLENNNTSPGISNAHKCNDGLPSRNKWKSSVLSQELPKSRNKTVHRKNAFSSGRRSPTTKNKSQLKVSTKAFTFPAPVPVHFNFSSDSPRNIAYKPCFIFSDAPSLSASPELHGGNALPSSNQFSEIISGLAAKLSATLNIQVPISDLGPSIVTMNTLTTNEESIVSGNNLNVKISGTTKTNGSDSKNQPGFMARNNSPADSIRNNTMFSELSEDLSDSMKSSSKNLARSSASGKDGNLQSFANYDIALNGMENNCSASKKREIIKSDPAETIRDNTMFSELSTLDKSKKILNASTTAPLLDSSSDLDKKSTCHDSASTSNHSTTSSDLVTELCYSMEALRFSKNLPRSSSTVLEKTSTLKNNNNPALSPSKDRNDTLSSEVQPKSSNLELVNAIKSVDFACNKAFGKRSLGGTLNWKCRESFDFKTSISDGFNFGPDRTEKIASDSCFIFTASPESHVTNILKMPANKSPTLRKSTADSRRIKNQCSFPSLMNKNTRSSGNEASGIAKNELTPRKVTIPRRIKIKSSFSPSTAENTQCAVNRTTATTSGSNIGTAAYDKTWWTSWIREIGPRNVDCTSSQRTFAEAVRTHPAPSFRFNPPVNVTSNQIVAFPPPLSENYFSFNDAKTNVPMLLALEMDLDEGHVRVAVEKYVKKYRKQFYTLSELADAVLEDGTSLKSNYEASIAIHSNENNDIEQEIRKLKEDRMCKICMENEVQMLYYPCGHLVACVNCACSIDLCPICRSPIKQRIRVFFT